MSTRSQRDTRVAPGTPQAGAIKERGSLIVGIAFFFQTREQDHMREVGISAAYQACERGLWEGRLKKKGFLP